LRVELPFWLMVPDCVLSVQVNGHSFPVEVKDSYTELYAGAVVDSRSTCVYIGPPQAIRQELQEAIRHAEVPTLRRKCKTVLLIRSACNKDVLAALGDPKRNKSAYWYMRSFCSAHIDVVNRLIRQYRLSTYDHFVYEVSPWDVPVWWVGAGMVSDRIVLLAYRAFDEKPLIFPSLRGGSPEQYKLIEPSEVQAAMAVVPSAGELELQDALNFIERGDYSGAIGRVTTAIEAQTEAVLSQELLKTCPAQEAEKKLKASENDFPGRLIQYQKLSKRKLPHGLAADLDSIRDLRHSIVHGAKRITYDQRGRAQRAVDTGRWIFNWLENQPARTELREKLIGKRMLGSHVTLFDADITSAGVVVHKPQFQAPRHGAQ
jgi:hypothetical protein